MKTSELKKRIHNISLIILYRLTLDLIYIYSISPIFYYDGYTLDFEIDKYVLSWVVFLFSYTLTSDLLKKDSINSLFIVVLYLIYFIPGTSLYGLHNIDNYYFSFYVLSFISLIILSKRIKLKDKDIKPFKFNISSYSIIIILIGLINILVMGYFGGFSLHFDLLDVYELRAEQSKMNLPVFVGYLQPFFAHLIPILITYTLIRKQYVTFIILTLAQLVSFSFGGSKYSFFAMFVAIAAAFVYNYRKRFKLIEVLLFVNILALVETYFTSTYPMIATFFHRRMCYIPNKLNSIYYDFFSKHELLYLRESVLRWLGFSSPYPVRTPLLIGREYYNRDMGANTGMFGDAFSQFGWVSILVYPLLYTITFQLVQRCLKGVDPRVTFTFVVLYSLTFIDGAFWSVLLTQGLIFVCLFYAYIRTNNIKI